MKRYQTVVTFLSRITKEIEADSSMEAMRRAEQAVQKLPNFLTFEETASIEVQDEKA